MHKLIALMGCLLFTGCATSGGVQGVKDQIKLVQEYTKLACSFVPTVSTVTAIFSKGAGQSVDTVGSSLCLAVTSVPLSEGGKRGIYVKGVRVHGTLNGRKI